MQSIFVQCPLLKVRGPLLLKAFVRVQVHFIKHAVIINSLMTRVPIIQRPLYFFMKELSYNPGHNSLELYNILLQIRFTTSKTKSDIQYSKLCIRVASRVAERFKTQNIRILGNQEILKKCQIWVDTEPSAQSPCKSLDFANSS